MSTTSDPFQLLNAILNSDVSGPGLALSWLENTDLDAVDWRLQRLLPLIYEILKAEYSHLAKVERLRGVSRYWWVKNNLILKQLPVVISNFNQAGIESTMLLKGGALAPQYYDKLQHRPMNDLDLAVRPEDAIPAMTALFSLGYTAAKGSSMDTTPDKIFSHCTQFCFTLNGVEMDLHWHILNVNSTSPFEESLWSNARQATVFGAECLVPRVEDLMAHILDHGAIKTELPPVWWNIDFALLLKAPEFDPHYFWSQARASGRVALFLNTISDWSERYAISCEPLIGSPIQVSINEKAYALFRTHHRRNGLIWRSWINYHNFRRYCGIKNATPGPIQFFDFLSEKWGFDSRGPAIRKLISKIFYANG